MTADEQRSGPTERLLDWAAAAMGESARITEVRPLHDEGPPWQLTVEHAGATTGAVLRAAIGPRAFVGISAPAWTDQRGASDNEVVSLVPETKYAQMGARGRAR